MKPFPELVELIELHSKLKPSIEILSEHGLPELKWVSLSIHKKQWIILVDDEYLHFSPRKPILSFFLLLENLVSYSESADYLTWTKENNLNASDPKLIDYYRQLGNTYSEITQLIDSFPLAISYYDYTMRTELGRALMTIDSTN